MPVFIAFSVLSKATIGADESAAATKKRNILAIVFAKLSPIREPRLSIKDIYKDLISLSSLKYHSEYMPASKNMPLNRSANTFDMLSFLSAKERTPALKIFISSAGDKLKNTAQANTPISVATSRRKINFLLFIKAAHKQNAHGSSIGKSNNYITSGGYIFFS